MICELCQQFFHFYIEQDRLSVEGRPPRRVYLVTLVWPWTWLHDIDIRPWPRYYEDLHVYKREVCRSRHWKV